MQYAQGCFWFSTWVKELALGDITAWTIRCAYFLAKNTGKYHLKIQHRKPIVYYYYSVLILIKELMSARWWYKVQFQQKWKTGCVLEIKAAERSSQVEDRDWWPCSWTKANAKSCPSSGISSSLGHGLTE